MRSETPFFSIIIPAYNADRYIAECLDSCLQQDIPLCEYEIICIDDCSSDDTADILRRYVDAYPNISVVRNESRMGVSYNRNIGIERACGVYIWFVDADDFIGDHAAAILKERCLSSDPDSLLFKGYYFNDSLSEEEQRLKAEGRLPAAGRYKTEFCTHRVFRSEIIKANDLRFIENVDYGEDQLFNFTFTKYSEKNEKFDCLLYFHRQHTDSVMHAVNMDNYFRSVVLGVDYLRAFSEQEAVPEKAKTIDYLILRLSFVLDMIAELPLSQTKKYLSILSQKGYYPYEPPQDVIQLIERGEMCGKGYYRRKRLRFVWKNKIAERILHPKRTISNFKQKFK